MDHYPQVGRFLDAFFPEDGGEPNIFQHEHYVFRADTETGGRGLQGRLDDLVAGYGRVARHLQDRLGRWHAIVQVQSETREGNCEQGLYYRKPTAGEISVQAGLALARGASGIVYFLYSSGVERVADADGNLLQLRTYEGIVDVDGAPTPTYAGVRRLNEQLAALSPVLAPLHFHGGYASSRGLPDDAVVVSADSDLEIGLFGNQQTETHVLVVNRRPDEARNIQMVLTVQGAMDAVSREALTINNGSLALSLPGGGMRLIELIRASADSAPGD